MKSFIPFLIALLFISLSYLIIEKFTVPFKDYKEPYFGFCYPAITAKQFATGKYDTFCWSNYAYDDCQKLNTLGYNCGRNLETGELLPCTHGLGTCKDVPQCFSTCYDQVSPWKQPYMIQVTRNDLIGLGTI